MFPHPRSQCSLGWLIFPLLIGNGEARSQAREKPTSADEKIHAYLVRATEQISKRFLDGATTRAEWEKRRPRLNVEFMDMLGLWPLPRKTPLKATITGTVAGDGFVVEKLHFQSRPGLYVTGNLYRPKKIDGKLPAILYVCGHSGRGRDGNKTAFQDHGVWFATNGYICLVIDTLMLGEIPGIHHGTYRYERWWWHSAGHTPAGVECWNGIRAIDYLTGRPDVDPDKIGVTGISGGGAYTVWIAAADERVKCAIPVSGMSDLESYVSDRVINGHCDCMFVVNTYAWEWTTLAALIAPRALLFANSDHDRIFPMDGNYRIVSRLRRLYKLYGKPDLFSDYASEGGHDYRPDLRIEIFQWMNRHLKNNTAPVQDVVFKSLPGKELRVFPEDGDIPGDAINGKIDEVFVPRAKVELPHEGKYSAWKNELIKELRQRSFRRFPERIPKARLGGYFNGNTVSHNQRLITEGDIAISFYSRVDLSKDPRRRTLVILEERERTGPLDWIGQFIGKTRYHAISPRTGWTKKSPPNYVERAHVLLGQTVDEGRVWDIAATARFLAATNKQEESTRIIGRGQAGILAAYAAIFEPDITEVVVVDPPTSHMKGPYFLNVLRVLDIPEALGLLAPRKLTLINAKDKAFDRTVEIYKRAGAEDKLRRQ
jgi:dienelactone hydrolase